MKKTGGQIEQEVYDLVKASALNAAISGSIYKQGLRPHNSKKEDITVSFLAGLDDQVQEGVLNINIYVINVSIGGFLLKDTKRCKEIEALALSSLPDSTDYKFSLKNTIQTFKVEGIDQHFVNVKLNFRRIT